MSVNMQINYELNRMVNSVTEQNQVRLEELWRYPLCVLYGSFPEIVQQMINTELAARIGNEQAFELVLAKDKQGMGPLEQAVNRLRGRMEEGVLNLKNQFYIPVIFMADQLNAKELADFMQELFRQMGKMGFGVAGECRYYCILNYEQMDGNLCKEQMAKLREYGQANYPVGIFTQNYLYFSEYEKYLKAVQAIAMHIFLQVSRSDLNASVLYDEEGKEILYFTLGYWKMDVLKQKIADYLIRCIESQSGRLMEYGKYSDKVRALIEQIMEFNTEEWISAFMHMPVNATALEPYLHPKIFRNPKLSYGELFQLLYGDVDAYVKFVKQNIGTGSETCYIEAFFQEDIGNLYAVEHDLGNVLSDIKEYYMAEIEKNLGSKNAYSDNFCFNRKCSVKSILSYLRAGFWDWDSRNLKLERKIKFIEAIQKYIASGDFREMLRKSGEQNEEEINRLKSIRREASMNEDNIIKNSRIEIRLSGEREIPIWNQNIFDNGVLERIENGLPDINDYVEAEVNADAVSIIGDYVSKIRELKQNHQDALYYAAKVDIPRVTQEKEYIFIGRRDTNRRNIVDEIQNVVKIKLPDAEVAERKWETSTCFELFVIKEIIELEEIYGIG